MTVAEKTVRYVLIVLIFVFITAETPSPWGIDELVGKKAPPFTLNDIQGRSVSLSSLQGKVVLITFWATWCPPCREEMPSLNELYKKYRNQGLIVLAVSTDRSVSGIKDFLSKHPVDFEILLGPDTQTSRQFRVFSLPTSFLLDKSGVVMKRYLGEEQWDSPEIRNEIKKALGIP
ncbi:MAG: TlpA disulfide reductase family protein [Thermodesulfovibrionales bacterium]|jgi:peroxiredoxin